MKPTNIHTESFISYYSRFYFDDPENTISKEDFEEAGLPKDLNRTDPAVESYITDKLLNGRFDAEAFAWKAGKAGWEDGEFKYIEPLKHTWVNGSGGHIKISKDSVDFTKEDFESYIEDPAHYVDIKKYNLDEKSDRRSLYFDIKDKYNLFNYGTVYLINHMFFLSKGAVPIYDRFAHVAVKALFMDKSPLEVYVPEAPGKNDHPKGKDKSKTENYYSALNTFEEYMWLLKVVFLNDIHKNGDIMYISRELDQALWVYGHATKKWSYKESE